MKLQSKRKKKKTAERLLAGALVLVMAFTALAPAEDASAATTVTYGKTVSGNNNSSEEIYSWYQIEDQEDLDNLWDTYQDYVPDWDGTAIPIMIVGNVGDTRIVIQSPGEGNNALYKPTWQTGYEDLSIFKHTYVYVIDTDLGLTYSQRYTPYYYTGSYYWDLMGWGDLASMDEEAIITRGTGGCFYLEKSDTPTTLSADQEYTFPYELHTYKEDDGVYSPSDEMFCVEDTGHYYWTAKISFKTGEDIANAPYTADPKSWMNDWRIVQYGNQPYFSIENYDLVIDGYCSILRKNTLSLSAGKCFRVHHSVKNMASYTCPGSKKDEDGKYLSEADAQAAVLSGSVSWNNTSYLQEENTTKENSNDGAWKKDTKFSVIDHYELWFGVPGAAYTSLNRVDGSELDSAYTDYLDKSAQTDAATVAERKSKISKVKDLETITVKNTLGLETRSCYNLKSGQTLTVNEGATLIVGRNTVLIADGNIVNNGTIIVQPGGTLTVLDLKDNQGIMSGTGKLIVRDGGKLKLRGLSISGEFSNDGFGLITDSLTPGSRYVSDGGTLITGYNANMDFIGHTSEELDSMVATYWGTGQTHGSTIRHYGTYSLKNGARLYYIGYEIKADS